MKIVYCCLLLLISLTVTADDSKELAELLEAYKTIQGNFEQSLKDEKGELIQESSGTFVVKSPGFFRWDTQDPFPQLLVSNLDKIWLYDPDLEQVTIRPYSQEVDQSPALLLSGDVEKISAIYNIQKVNTDADTNKLTSRFVLTPKVTNNVFIQLELGFINKDLSEMYLADSLGQTTRFILKDTILNKAVENNVFEFDIPEGVDVLTDE